VDLKEALKLKLDEVRLLIKDAEIKIIPLPSLTQMKGSTVQQTAQTLA